MEVKLHDIGEGMTEAEILNYFVKKGDQVLVDQPLVEIRTDKMTAELPSPGKGVVRDILIDCGSTVTVGTTLLVIENSDVVTTNNSDFKNGLQKENLEQTSSETFRILAAPYTRKIARENGINIELVKGTGPAGRILDEDVYRYIEQQKSLPITVEQIQNATHNESPTVVQQVGPLHQINTIPFNGRRKQIAKKMVQSMFTIPHVTHFEEIDMTNLLSIKNNFKHLEREISVPAFFVKALTIALHDYPIFNARLDETNETVHLYRNIHIGLATDTQEGLIVPVLRNAESKTIGEIHNEVRKLTKKAQENNLGTKDITGSTFTISNVGPLGSTGATPIINYPETGLMAFHATKEKPAVYKGEIAIRSLMNISMSFDHRVADGGTAVAFTNRFKSLIENPTLLLLELV
ncbi:dihydrolipoamide acetyltransferase family protein [Peribacillus sp. SCS-155]|uniref:dihydrolipoamide acetyltransferase family protein n=1 Tax=Peribacillus sedimenti TaxID=3115297 RepID=UPI003905C57A